MSGQWRARKQGISWIEGANGEDGLLLERGVSEKDYLVVEDVRGSNASDGTALGTKTLMKNAYFTVGGRGLVPQKVFPSKDLKKVLIATDVQSNWRHSFYAKYWIFDVATQTAEALDSGNLDGRVQLASWSPQSDAIVFTRDNNLFLRKLSSPAITQITTDGGTNLFYGVPDWVYEEEVFASNSATWWAEDGKYVAFLRTNETEVPEYPIQYFVSRPSGVQPLPGEESYPEVRGSNTPKPAPQTLLLSYNFTTLQKEMFLKSILRVTLNRQIDSLQRWSGLAQLAKLSSAKRTGRVIYCRLCWSIWRRALARQYGLWMSRSLMVGGSKSLRPLNTFLQILRMVAQKTATLTP